MATVQLAVGDDAFALGADVDQDLVLVDTDYAAFDHVAVLEALDVGVLLGEQLLHRGGFGAKAPHRRRLLFLTSRRCVREISLADGRHGFDGGVDERSALNAVGDARRCVCGRCVCGRCVCGRWICSGHTGVVPGGLLDYRYHGGECLRFRRGPALLLFGQGGSHS